MNRNTKGQFIKGHSTLKNWGFQKGNKLGELALKVKGRHNSPITEFKSGLIPWNKGKILPYKARPSMRGRLNPMSEETKLKIKLARQNYRPTLETRKKQSMAHINWMKSHNQNGNTAKAGWATIGGKKIYFRSKWERNYACYLEWLKVKGKIKDWDFEVDTFWFDNIKRGVRSYLPDFKVFDFKGQFEYHEVKGWMDPRSATKLKRMAKYYPQVKLILIDKDYYNSLKKWAGLIPNWE